MPKGMTTGKPKMIFFKISSKYYKSSSKKKKKKTESERERKKKGKQKGEKRKIPRTLSLEMFIFSNAHHSHLKIHNAYIKALKVLEKDIPEVCYYKKKIKDCNFFFLINSQKKTYSLTAVCRPNLYVDLTEEKILRVARIHIRTVQKRCP